MRMRLRLLLQAHVLSVLLVAKGSTDGLAVRPAARGPTATALSVHGDAWRIVRSGVLPNI